MIDAARFNRRKEFRGADVFDAPLGQVQVLEAPAKLLQE